MWQLEWAEHTEWLLDLAEDGEAPRALLDMPGLSDETAFVWGAFWSLSSDRPPTFGGVGQIPFSAIDRYAVRYGVTCRDEFDRFERLIRAMDAVFRAHVMENAGKED